MSVNTQTPDEFAYGTNQHGNCECPAMAAGFEPGEEDMNGLLQAVDWYDMLVTNNTKNRHQGIISAEKAKEFWLEMLDDAVDFGDPEAKPALKVAESLGWADPEDYEL